MTSRRRFLAASGSTLAAAAMSSAKDKDRPLLSFGLMADCQYADIDTVGARFYRQSPGKLREAVAALNKQDLSFSFHLGDFIDRDFKSFADLNPITARLKSTLYHALGNHDFDVPDDLKSQVPAQLGLKKGYYSFRQDGFRFLVLDTTEVSTYRYPANDPKTKAAQIELQKLSASKLPFAQSWNSRAGDQQVAWLKSQLKSATRDKETVLVFGHHPILPKEGHCTWNQQELHQILQEFKCCKAYLNGHNHAGGYTQVDGVHYLTLDGMLNTKDQNAYAYAHLFPLHLEIKGFGRQESHLLKFR
jgi:manganese-dependent ADP-ribose/CDP-alcohol diphosphatase